MVPFLTAISICTDGAIRVVRADPRWTDAAVPGRMTKWAGTCSAASSESELATVAVHAAPSVVVVSVAAWHRQVKRVVYRRLVVGAHPNHGCRSNLNLCN